ncbi:34-kDa subunit of RNA polymerase III (C) [Marasmius tenuissimus]|uniref:34-kDa subunit of RNA polymerase III (C) n=1 Tax=Marasmius tenuissimus TaxID=585030 RepID=A0ABR3AB69_9AGAR
MKEKSCPKRRSQSERALYPISKASQYPTAEYVQKKLREARITPTELSVEHVEMLLNVLVLDGEIEKLPAFGGAIWDTSTLDDEDSSNERHSKKKKRRRRYSDSDSERDKSRRKMKKKKQSVQDSDSDSSNSDAVRKSKTKRSRDKDDSDSDIPKSKKKAKKRRDDSDSESSEEESSRRRNKRKSRKSRDSSEESSSSESEDERRHRSKSKSTKRSPSPPIYSFDDYDEERGTGGVYRAIRQERLDLGWSQAPCSVCPSFEFCKEDGPVNPRDCVYYTDWLVGGTVAAIEDAV